MTKKCLISCGLALSILSGTGQNECIKIATGPTENYAKTLHPEKKGQFVRIMFYNVENLYDPYDDTTKLDEEFTSDGKKHWNFSRFKAKLYHLSKLILAIGQGDPPAIVGMCEIENRYVLNRLIYETPLRSYNYRVIHYDSPDARGVDAALIYRPDRVKVVSSEPVRIRFPFDTMVKTRDILYVKAVLLSSDTVHVFVNHWPSRRGGAAESAPRRHYVAGILRKKTDSLFSANPFSNIIIMGDFNDEPDNESLSRILYAGPDSVTVPGKPLVNLMAYKLRQMNMGTIKYQGRWSVFDQFIVSCSLLGNTGSLKTSMKDAHIFHEGFLLDEDSRFLGLKLKRTYTGPRYTGGFSDHLPVYLDVWETGK